MTFPTAPALELVERNPGEFARAYELRYNLRYGSGSRLVWRLRKRARCDQYIADQIAVVFGLHPSALWPEWFGVAA